MADGTKQTQGESIKSLLQRLDAEEGVRPVGTMGFAERSGSPLQQYQTPNSPEPNRAPYLGAPSPALTGRDENDNFTAATPMNRAETDPQSGIRSGRSAKMVAGVATVAIAALSSWLWFTPSQTPATQFANADSTSTNTSTPTANKTPQAQPPISAATTANLLDAIKTSDEKEFAVSATQPAEAITPAAENQPTTGSKSPPKTTNVDLAAADTTSTTEALPGRTNLGATTSTQDAQQNSARVPIAPPIPEAKTALAVPDAATLGKPQESGSQFTSSETAPETRLVAAATNALGDWLFESNKQRTQVQLQAEPFLSTKGGRDIKLPFEIGPATAYKDIASIVLRGLPEGYSVSAASTVGDGSWILVPSSLRIARLKIPQVASQTVDLDISIFSVEAELLAHRRIQISITPDHVSRSLKAQDTQALINRGSQLFDSGDIAGARLVFERAAEGGSAHGAYALGTTYDPNKLAEKGVLGLSGDVPKAREWYSRAQQQGIPEAAFQLQNLPSN